MTIEQPPPIPNDSPSIWQLVLTDMAEREQLGIKRYGTVLQAFNGRDALQDAYEEVLDLCAYLRQVIEERKAFTQNSPSDPPGICHPERV